MATFTWSPQTATQEAAPRVLSASFGDGYQQRVAFGINTQPRKWSLTFRDRASALQPAVDFLVARAGVESFDWTPPAGAAGKFVCDGWSATPHSGRGFIDLSATFREVFGE